ncbi:MAG: phosphatidate cytidylyltransferase [Flavobacterium sp. BFFFF1]|uniref:phosphatidate cytidylyltransferase n=1 Tax=Flavobacterium sp. BFFFF1 TaxID=2015557 RepID=UPI000BD2411D|nr:phosphatidate cytidylyltransferase [Flavobacterium sp. BFFFF1]OYU79092.1 MAG: phosphatidate cytidylyltransferase [Flavobacterium sp. BFFFF1]
MNETLKRGISGTVYIVLLIVSIFYSTESFFALFGLFLLIAVYEFCSLVHINKVFPLLFAITFYAYSTYLLFNKIDVRTIDLVFLGITILVSLKAMVFLFSKTQESVSTFSKYIYLLGYIILPFIAITKITALGQFNSHSAYTLKTYSPKIMLGVFIIIWTNDTFAYIVGKSIGKHKLFERISPKKTIEGFLGGVLFAVLAGYLISRFYIAPSPIHLQKSIIIWAITAFVVSVFGTIGDLVESKFKRIAGVKDSGKIMPGHGGILDRLDSVIFAAPFIFLFYQILNLL